MELLTFALSMTVSPSLRVPIARVVDHAWAKHGRDVVIAELARKCGQ